MSTIDRRGAAQAEPHRPDPETVSLSGYEVAERYGPDTVETQAAGDPPQPHDRIGVPGQFPFTRGVHPTMYRSRLWTMRQFAGFGSAADTNARFKYLLENAKGTKANTGLSTAFDLPTLMGRDSDDPLSSGEVGRCGVAIDTIEDMDRLYADIPLEDVTVSQTINGPAAVIWAMYLAMARSNATSVGTTLGGTLQNDILKEFHAQNEFIYPPEAIDEAGRGHDRVPVAASCREVEQCFDLGISHPRSGIVGHLRSSRLRCGTGWSMSRRVDASRDGHRSVRRRVSVVLL